MYGFHIFYILISASLCFGASEAKGIEFDKDDGEYSIEVELEGGSGKASVTSPTLITVKIKLPPPESSGAALIMII